MIFDVDGTLVDSNDLHTDCWVEAFAHFGKRVERDVSMPSESDLMRAR